MEPKTHEIKSWPKYFEMVLNGEKNFEVRKDDRMYRVGDSLLLKEWDPITKTYSAREIEKEITSKVSGGIQGIEPGYCVLGFAIDQSEKRDLSIAGAGMAVGFSYAYFVLVEHITKHYLSQPGLEEQTKKAFQEKLEIISNTANSVKKSLIQILKDYLGNNFIEVGNPVATKLVTGIFEESKKTDDT